MHGLKTIHELNGLAAQNANAKVTLEKAEEKLRQSGSPLDNHLYEVLGQRAKQRGEVLERFRSKTVEELVSYVGGLQAPTLLEVVLAEKLFEFVKGERDNAN